MNGEPVESVTHLVCSGPYVLVLPQSGLVVELHSTFVGHSAVPTQATHLLLGPVGRPPHVATRDDASGIIDPVNRPDSCLYTHSHELIDLLEARGLDLRVDRVPMRAVQLSQ